MFQAIIRDFQSLEEAKLNIQGVTVIVGESNSGKSACCRAIYAAATNRFKAGQVRHGEDHATIAFKVDNQPEAMTVQRSWAGGSPKIKLGTQVFSKLGRTLPREVTEYLNLGFIDLSGEQYSCNFHTQFQKPMLLEYSQQRVMEILSASSALDDLKEAKEVVLEERAANKGAIQAVDKMLEEVTAKCNELTVNYQIVKPLCEAIIEECSRLESLLESKTDADALEQLAQSIFLLREEYALTEQVVSTSKELQDLLVVLEGIQGLESLLNHCNNIAEKTKILQQVLQYDTEATQQLSDVVVCCELLESRQVVKLHEDRVSTMCKTASDALQTQESQLEWSNLVSDADSLMLLLESKQSIEKRMDELNEIVLNHKCPLCGSIVHGL